MSALRRWRWTWRDARRTLDAGARVGLSPHPTESVRDFRRRLRHYYFAAAGWPPVR